MLPAILVVDKTKADRIQLRKAVDPKAFEVVEASSIKGALSAFAVHPEIKAVLMDVGFDDGTGLDLVTSLRKVPNGDEVAVFVVTAQEHPAWFTEAKRLGIRGWVAKPVSREQLSLLLRTF